MHENIRRKYLENIYILWWSRKKNQKTFIQFFMTDLSNYVRAFGCNSKWTHSFSPILFEGAEMDDIIHK